MRKVCVDVLQQMEFLLSNQRKENKLGRLKLWTICLRLLGDQENEFSEQLARFVTKFLQKSEKVWILRNKSTVEQFTGFCGAHNETFSE